MPEETRCDGRFEQHRRLRRGNFARADALHRALARAASDHVGRNEIQRIARRLVPIVALHVFILARDERAPDAVARARVAIDESKRVAVNEVRFLGRDRRAFGIAHEAVDREAGVLADFRELDRALDRQIPWMPQIEVGNVAREQLGIGKPRSRIRRGKARDRKCGVDGVAQSLREKSELLACPRCWPT